ncbi:type 1 glutamine amidotransferase domain-containing protein [Companilactobacillus sp.]|jgi:putative intracellular protease/amidase|uniref:type 1 glutamine amidotransferase domain-containing protein n=1 Tax=Companilactobacillus sp. TaxID=2767905 RepID=UPI0025BAB28A|nr:type 1 glutamine amidotransferase domain-containing protein [Companilactobacillus sp.]MCH4007916.1 type 1 glutamine amidotransferase domain-containing protein [Companilactobacillus sp.]MCH4051905.1 type 1 glutamine amidotransferase domain-containing protein [Companilactobacillus sp.]MCH4075859.1 type 1 glutamine amidotransferase domain-containing protein [Companilactobacillus sp.]MCH4124434.1 type 1 glutamine amidotransferase domain-containing protein [Companilactobacillus sp.]MCH4132603.1 
MKKILVVLTNYAQYGKRKEATGLWLGEATEFVREVNKAGFDVDYVSPNGGYVPIDPRSIKYASTEDLEMYNSEDFRTFALARSMKANEIKSANYCAIYFTGGHGVMWDFPHNEILHKISLDIFNNEGYLTSVCHGISALLYMKDWNDEWMIKGKHITGFTNSEEILSGKRNRVPFLNENIAKEHGAIFEKKRAYSEYAIQDGQFITGQNPFSPKAVAKILVKNLKKK